MQKSTFGPLFIFNSIHRQQKQLQHIAFTLGGSQKSHPPTTLHHKWGKQAGESQESLSRPQSWRSRWGETKRRGRTWRRRTTWKNPWSVTERELWGRTEEGRAFLWSPRQECRSSAVRGEHSRTFSRSYSDNRKVWGGGNATGKGKSWTVSHWRAWTLA